MANDASHTDRLALALKIAAKGLRVFPCAPDTEPGRKAKAPWPGCEWKQEATSDQRTIRAWFRDRPSMNYGIALDAAHFVLDLDRNADFNGRDDLTLLEIDNDLIPSTFAVKTPSGGEHLYFSGNAPNSVRKKSLGQAIDVRGDGGYVVGPGSMIDGKPYEITHNCEIAAAPEWLLSLAAKEIVEPVKRDPYVSLDAPGEIGRMRTCLANLVKQGDVAIEHCGGNDRTYKLLGCGTDK